MGPALAGSVPPLDRLIAQVRRGSAAMPAVGAAQLDDQGLADLRAWLVEQRAPGRWNAGGVPLPNPNLIEVPPGVDVELVAHGLEHPVALALGPIPAGAAVPAGTAAPGAGAMPRRALFVTTNGGWYTPPKSKRGKVLHLDTAGEPRVFVEGLDRPMGLVWVDEELFVSTRTEVTRWRDRDGDGRAELEATVVADLPGRGLHHAAAIALGPDRRLYLGMGTRSNADIEGEHDHNGTILSFELDGSDLKVFARGFRNPFDLAFTPDGELFATDNGTDPPFVAAAVEELNHVVAGGHYGHPWMFGSTAAPGRAEAAARLRHVPPVVELPTHVSANGILCHSGKMFPELAGRLLLAEYGSHLKGYTTVGRRIASVAARRNGDTEPARVETWASGFIGRPLDLLEGNDGSVYVTDFTQGAVFRVFRSTRRREAVRPSFDCRRANGVVMFAICNDRELAALDRSIAERYAALASRDDLARQVRTAQRSWLAERDRCASAPHVARCLADQLRGRDAALRELQTSADAGSDSP